MIPKEISRYVGDDAVFNCKSYMKGKWTFINKKLPPNAVVTGNRDEVLTIHKINRENNGTYQCIITDNPNNLVAEGTLKVYGEYYK